MRVGSFILLLLAVGGWAIAQSADSPLRFDSVTIKRATNASDVIRGRASWGGDQCAGGPGTRDPGLLKCDAITFAQLVGQAYHLGPIQLVTQPWMESQHFQIEAKIPNGATQDQVRIMEQNLLAERFKLAAHVVKGEVVAYEMSAPKEGVKFRAAHIDPKTTLIAYGLGYVEIHNRPLSMEQLASFLSDYLSYPVVDATGLAGTYEIHLRFAAETSTRLAAPPLDPALPPIEAVRDQLGLVLERTKTVVDVLIVDHVEKTPTASSH